MKIGNLLPGIAENLGHVGASPFARIPADDYRSAKGLLLELPAEAQARTNCELRH
ncbi:MAG: hypothetical protein ABI268_10825 [Rhodanobacter sp.]